MTLRIAALDSEDEGKTPNYDKEKYREMILDAAETVLGPFGLIYGDSKKGKMKMVARTDPRKEKRYSNRDDLR